ncbi:alpha/beta fold hydrolase [Ruegeria marina]|uniref:Pimeloyl-ACP methyl ester carboxylesterase n=1 Tax=Ruegeria marina TaxID=639004 RepID=A0A1G6RNA6_9RHOB|nr:alpha/beta fold hydrolase [Ruegeria marina]SDD05911.1 Pimeloyl-ACP methyl ester carboxylesterase [Ruegeria marina]
MQIEANGIRIEVEEHGPSDGVPMILIRGQGSQLAHWPATLYEGFAKAGYRVILFDNRDVGLTQRCPADGVPGDADSILDLLRGGGDIPKPYGIEDMVGDITGLMDTLGIERAHMFGISMGGAVLQQVCIDHPERVLSASIVMTACRPFAERAPNDRTMMLALVESLLVRDMTRAEYLDAQVAEHGLWGSPGYPMPEADIRAMAARAWDRGVDAEGRNRQVLAILHASDRRPALRNLALPCFVIHGTDDTLVPLAMGEEIAATIPGSEFRAIEGMGHIITPALAPLIVELVTDFIARRG